MNSTAPQNAPAPPPLPTIPLTKEFLTMMNMEETAAYALRPVFATRCERLSSTNVMLERAVLVTQEGTMMVFDTKKKRVTHQIEFGANCV